MATVYRFKVVLSNFLGGPGLNVWHMCQAGALGGADQSDLEGMAADINAVYDALRTNMVSGVKYDIAPIVEGFDVETGSLSDVVGITPPTGNNGMSTGTISRATQLCVRLKTDAIRGNRLMQGRHFIGPIGAGAIGSDGQVTSGVRSAVPTAYGGVLDINGNGRLVVYGRKYTDKDGVTHPGKIGYVQAVICNSVPGTLRSRKA